MESLGLARSAGLLQELLNFSFEGETAARMAQFDRDIDRCEKASGETFSENIRIGVALRMLPDGPLKQHLVLNSARLTTWETLKADIDNVRRAQTAASSTPQPMDLSACVTQELDSFQKGKSRGKGKGKDKGKPKDDLPKTPCPICGKAGHWKKDCWYNIPNGWDEAKAQGQEQGQRRQGQDLYQHPAAVEQRQEAREVLELRRSGTRRQGLSEEESEVVGCGESGATIIILWCYWRDDVDSDLGDEVVDHAGDDC